MSDELKIDIDWLGGQTGSSLDRAFYADIGVAAGEEWLTLLEDQEARTVRSHLRGSAYRLALWFAANWWRLRWEPEIHDWWKNADWRMAHGMGSAGGGYVWPNLIFASDGDSLAVASRPGRKTVPFEPVRYLNLITARVTAENFERTVDSFLTKVLARLDSMEVEDEALSGLWLEVAQERRDPETSRQRKLEALCGYDPDEAPASMIDRLVRDQSHFGPQALAEMAAQGRGSTEKILAGMETLADLKGPPKRGGFRGQLPARSSAWRNLAATERPWRRASMIARKAREKWGLGSSPISNRKLAELLSTSEAVFTRNSEVQTPFPAAFRRGSETEVDLFFHSLRSTSRRFSAARLLGDHLSFAPAERLIPETDAKTARQQFQRAFAQEFLCPFEELCEAIDSDLPSEANYEEAAERFGVSPLLVKTTLVNHGALDRDLLTTTY